MKLTRYIVFKDETGQTVSFEKVPPLQSDTDTANRYEISVNDGRVGYVYGEPDEKLAAQMLILYGEVEE